MRGQGHFSSGRARAGATYGALRRLSYLRAAAFLSSVSAIAGRRCGSAEPPRRAHGTRRPRGPRALAGTRRTASRTSTSPSRDAQVAMVCAHDGTLPCAGQVDGAQFVGMITQLKRPSTQFAPPRLPSPKAAARRGRTPATLLPCAWWAAIACCRDRRSSVSRCCGACAVRRQLWHAVEAFSGQRPSIGGRGRRHAPGVRLQRGGMHRDLARSPHGRCIPGSVHALYDAYTHKPVCRIGRMRGRQAHTVRRLTTPP